jgi:hypothetical protein
MQIFHQSVLGYEFKNLQKNKQILITLFFVKNKEKYESGG